MNYTIIVVDYYIFVVLFQLPYIFKDKKAFSFVEYYKMKEKYKLKCNKKNI